MNRLAYELATFSDIASVTELTLDELSKLSAIEFEDQPRNTLGSLFEDTDEVVEGSGWFAPGIFPVSQEDTFYDGSFIRHELRKATLGGRSALELDILGPHWDRIFRCHFFDVEEIDHPQFKGILTFAEIHHMDVNSLENGCSVCEFRSWVEGQYLKIVYRQSSVQRLMLREPLKRETPVES